MAITLGGRHYDLALAYSARSCIPDPWILLRVRRSANPSTLVMVRERERAIELVDDAIENLRAGARELYKIDDEESAGMLNMLARVVYSVAFKQMPGTEPVLERPGPDE